MKKFTKVAAMILAVACIMSLAACGGRADSEYVGSYTAVVGEAMGIALSGDDMSGFDLELKEKGKGTVTIDGDEGSCKWSNDDTTVTITVDGEDMVATPGQDTLTFDDMLGMGLKVTFAKVGTDAANPENYLPEEEKKMLGTWTSNAVTDMLGDDVSDEVSPTAVTVEFRGDHTATATMNGNDLGEGTWYVYSGSGYFENDNYPLPYWDMDGDNMLITYSSGDDYWIFTCTKQ